MSHILEFLDDIYNMMATSLHAWCIPDQGKVCASISGRTYDNGSRVTGDSARAVADFAAQLEIPVVRFVADGELSPGDAPKPFYERPAVLVFANEDGLTAFGDVMEESIRLVISPSRYCPQSQGDALVS